jgi:uracil-DNA glycosylase family 4
MDRLEGLLQQIRSCRICEDQLPLGPNPVLRAATSAQLLIVGQAPGAKVHASGIPWDDQSGKRLRKWLNLTPESFYDETKVAIVPMAFCYPGKGKTGDLPPRQECAQHWHQQVLALLPNIKLTLLVGKYAQNYFLGAGAKQTLTDTVLAWNDYLPTYLPLPHPSPQNQFWLRRNPWFETEIVPFLQESIPAFVKQT